MANIKAVLVINDYGTQKPDSVTSNKKQNNASLQPYEYNIDLDLQKSRKNEKYNGFLLGGIIGKDGIPLYKGYKGFMFGLPNYNGKYPLEIAVLGESIVRMIFTFDDDLEQYPKSYTVIDVDGSERDFVNDSYVIEIEFASFYGYRRIIFNDWTVTDYNVAIKSIQNVEGVINIDKRALHNLDTYEQLTSDAELVAYGLLPNTGKIVVDDFDRKIANKSELGWFEKSVYNVYIYTNNNLVQTHIGDSSSYDNSKAQMEFELTNDISLFKTTYINPEDFKNVTTAYEVLSIIMWTYYLVNSEYMSLEDFVLNEMPKYFNDEYVNWFIPYEDTIQMYDTDLRQIRLATLLQMFYLRGSLELEKMTVYDALVYFCEAFRIFMYIDDNNVVKFTSARPLIASSENSKICLIKPSIQISTFEYDLTTKNRYVEVKIE